MSKYRFSQRSLDRMQGVHPDLVAVMHRALELTPIDFTVLEGLRTEDRQRKLVAKGASQTMNSRHLTGHAIDIAPLDDDGNISWDWPLYYKIEPAVKQAAKEVGVPIEWGGDWTSFKDGPHWQLPWKEYGKSDMTPRHKAPPPEAETEEDDMLSTALISSVVKGAIREEIGGRIMDRVTGDKAETPPAPPAKSFLESKTIWGVVLMFAPTVGRMFGVEITGADLEEGAMHAETIIESLGALLALYGRATAKAPIKARG